MQQTYIKRFSHNKFFGYLITYDTLWELRQLFSSAEIKIGLKYADDVVYKRINLNYLKKTMETGIELSEGKSKTSLERLYKKECNETTPYSLQELKIAFEKAKDDGLDLSILKLTLLIKTLEYGGYINSKH